MAILCSGVRADVQKDKIQNAVLRKLGNIAWVKGTEKDGNEKNKKERDKEQERVCVCERENERKKKGFFF